MSIAEEQWRRDEQRKRLSRIIRWSFGLPMLFLSVPLLGLAGVYFTVLGAILLAPDISGYFANFAGGLLWNSRSSGRQPLYGIAETLAAKGKYAEAEAEYEKIIEEFPTELKPHVDLITIAVRWLNNAALAEELYQRGMTLLQDPDAKKTLTQMYETVRTRLKSAEELAPPTPISAAKISDVKERLERDRQKLWR